MTFKINWEKKSTHYQISDMLLEAMVRCAYPEATLQMVVVLSGGCANLNVKIQLASQATPLLLRVYLRDPEAALREQQLAFLLHTELPVPLTHYIGVLEGYHFAITDFLPGVPLRDLLLGPVPYDLGAVMFEVGQKLATISRHTFTSGGFLDTTLQVKAEAVLGILSVAKQCLDSENVKVVLTAEKRERIVFYLEKYQQLLPSSEAHQLVHGDFDPANILVDNVTGDWKVTGILDWEFAFSGSFLWDVANMLRYSHQMPERFEGAFLQGLTQGGIVLPQGWQITIQLLNLIALLDCLERTQLKNCPKQCADIEALVSHILLDLKIQEE